MGVVVLAAGQVEGLLHRRDKEDVWERGEVGVDETVEHVRDRIASVFHGTLAPVSEVAHLDAVHDIAALDLRAGHVAVQPGREGVQEGPEPFKQERRIVVRRQATAVRRVLHHRMVRGGELAVEVFRDGAALAVQKRRGGVSAAAHPGKAGRHAGMLLDALDEQRLQLLVEEILSFAPFEPVPRVAHVA